MGKTYGNRLYQVSEWIMRLAYLNLLWIVFTLVGLVLFGLFPATAAAFTVARRWISDEPDFPVFRTFMSSFKKEFWKSQFLGLSILVIGIILYLDFVYFDSQISIIFTGLKVLTIILFFIYIMTLVFIFPVFVHYKLSFYQYIRNAILVSMLNPFPTIIILSGIILNIFIMGKLPGLIPFFSISAPVLLITVITQQVFNKIEVKKNQLVKS